jgi:short-subunit dehydrogenase
VPGGRPLEVLVTGASSGIGAAVAARFAAQGASLTLLGRDRARLERSAARALDGAARASVRTVRLDLARPRGLEGALRRLAARLPRLDALVHAAGVFVGGPVLAARRPFHDMLQVNAYAALTVTRALLPALERARGTVVFINSAGVLRPPLPLTAQYIAAKHLLSGITEALREELNPRGVRVTNILPARTATPMQESLQALEGRSYDPEVLLQPEDVAELIACAVNLPGRAQVVDLVARPMTVLPAAARAPRARGAR